MYVNEASNRGIRGAGIVLKGPDSVIIKYSLKLIFKEINNMMEYEALSKGLELVREMKSKQLSVYNNS